MMAFAILGLKSQKLKLNKAKISVLFAIALGVSYALFKNLAWFVNFPCFIGFYCGLKFKVIGLTGGIATGKSTVSNILKSEGFDIIDSDQISKDLRNNDEHYKRLLRNTFGEEIWVNG